MSLPDFFDPTSIQKRPKTKLSKQFAKLTVHEEATKDTSPDSEQNTEKLVPLNAVPSNPNEPKIQVEEANETDDVCGFVRIFYEVSDDGKLLSMKLHPVKHSDWIYSYYALNDPNNLSNCRRRRSSRSNSDDCLKHGSSRNRSRSPNRNHLRPARKERNSASNAHEFDNSSLRHNTTPVQSVVSSPQFNTTNQVDDTIPGPATSPRLLLHPFGDAFLPPLSLENLP